MKCRLPCSAARTDRGALLIFIREKMSNASSKPHLGGAIPQSGVSRAHLQHIFRAVGMYRHATVGSDQSPDCRTSLRMVLSFEYEIPQKPSDSAPSDCTSCLGALSAEATRLCPIRRSRVRWLAKTQAISARRLCCISQNIEKIGLPRHSGLPRPTIHALRHTFAVRALETCPDDRDRITRHMVALSTYLIVLVIFFDSKRRRNSPRNGFALEKAFIR